MQKIVSITIDEVLHYSAYPVPTLLTYWKDQLRKSSLIQFSIKWEEYRCMGKLLMPGKCLQKRKKINYQSARIFTIYEISCPNSLKLTKMLVLRLCREIWPEVEWAALKLSPVISTDFDKWVTALGRNKQYQEKVLCSPGRYKRDTKWKILLR